jgi:L-ribulose-5-phosphate 4-epimerase
LSHAALYTERPDVGAVIHIHSRVLWERSRDTLPTTDPAYGYGTAELALALGALARGLEVRSAQILVMGGHPPGLMVFDKDLDAAGERVLRLQGLKS